MATSDRFVPGVKQWYLLGPPGSAAPGAGVGSIAESWTDYTGAGIRTAIVDNGFAYDHPSLARNYDKSADLDTVDGDADAAADNRDFHGTAVAGIVAASGGDGTAVGVSPDATIVGIRIGYGKDGDVEALAEAIRYAATADTMNASWSFREPLADNFALGEFRPLADAMAYAAREGRGGLGTVMVFSAGNLGQDVNLHDVQNSIYAITVAAYAPDGKPSSFSNRGAAVLVAAPGERIWTTDIPDKRGYSFYDEFYFSGTSAAAPIVTGVANLMLDANPALGARDVQEILAYSARPLSSAPGTANGAETWNGGGLRFSPDVGFGAVDALAATRLAETWQSGATFDTMQTATAGWKGALGLGARSVEVTLDIAEAIRIDRVELALDLEHERLADLRVRLFSPDGTRSIVLDRPPVQDDGVAGPDALVFTVSSNAFWGELGAGAWRVRVMDLAEESATGLLRSLELRVYGDAETPDQTYVYTDAFATLGTPGPLIDADAGNNDTLNAAAVTAGLLLDLRPGAVQQIAGRALVLGSATWIENALGGDGADRITGNGRDNLLWGGRGDDVLAGAGGADRFAFGARSGADRIADFAADDLVVLTGGVTLAGLEGSRAVLSDGATLQAANGWVWSAADFEMQDNLWA